MPPVAAAYQLNVGVTVPEVVAADTVGTPEPHCDALAVVGAVGWGATTTLTVLFVAAQVVVVLVAVTV